MSTSTAPTTFETVFYLETPVGHEVLQSFVDSFEGRLNGMSITDVRLRSSRLAKPDPKKIAAALAGADAPAQILLIAKGEDGNNNDPAFYLNLTLLPSIHPEANCYALCLGAPPELEAVFAETWFGLAAVAGLTAGLGFQQRYPNDSFGYATFNAGAPLDPDDSWLRIYDAFVRYVDDPASFHPVAQGKMLRSVLPFNFMPTALADEIKQALTSASLPIDGFADLGRSALWTVPSVEHRRTAYDALIAKNLVWETTWIDVAHYRPPE